MRNELHLLRHRRRRDSELQGLRRRSCRRLPRHQSVHRGAHAGHPEGPLRGLLDTPDETLAAVVVRVKMVAAHLRPRFPANGFNILQNKRRGCGTDREARSFPQSCRATAIRRSPLKAMRDRSALKALADRIRCDPAEFIDNPAWAKFLPRRTSPRVRGTCRRTRTARGWNVESAVLHLRAGGTLRTHARLRGASRPARTCSPRSCRAYNGAGT